MGVVQGVAVRQHALLHHRAKHLLAADLPALIVAHPEDEVVDGGVQRRGSQRGELVGHPLEPLATCDLCVRLRPAGYDLQGVVREVGAGHPEGREDPRFGVVAERHPRLHLDHARQQVVGRVRIGVLRAGREVDRLLVVEHPQDLLERDDIGEPDPAERHRVRPVANPARVVDQVARRDYRAEVGQFRDVAAHVRIEVEVAFGFEKESRHGAELLGYRRDVEDRFRRDGDGVIEVRGAVPGTMDHLPIPSDPYRRPGPVAPKVGEDRVDFRIGRTAGTGPGSGRGRAAGSEDQEAERCHGGLRDRGSPLHGFVPFPSGSGGAGSRGRRTRRPA